MADEKVMEITVEELARIKKIVYKGKADMCWFSPNRKEAKGLIAMAEKQLGVFKEESQTNTQKKPKEKKHERSRQVPQRADDGFTGGEGR